MQLFCSYRKCTHTKTENNYTEHLFSCSQGLRFCLYELQISSKHSFFSNLMVFVNGVADLYDTEA